MSKIKSISHRLGLTSLTFGYLSYPNFSAPNDDPMKPQGLAMKLFNTALQELSTDLKSRYPRQCNWGNFIKLLHEHKVDVVIDPVVATPSRSSLDFIYYCQVRCFQLVYHNIIRKHIMKGISVLAKAWDSKNYREVQAVLEELPPAGTRFVIGEGLYEEDFLRYFGVGYEAFKFDGDAVTPILDAVKDRRLIITDVPFGQAVLEQLPERERDCYGMVDMLLGSPPRIRELLSCQKAGFVVRRDSRFHELFSCLNMPEIFHRLCEDEGANADKLGVELIDGTDTLPPGPDSFLIPLELEKWFEGQLPKLPRPPESTVAPRRKVFSTPTEWIEPVDKTGIRIAKVFSNKTKFFLMTLRVVFWTSLGVGFTSLVAAELIRVPSSDFPSSLQFLGLGFIFIAAETALIDTIERRKRNGK